MKEKSYIWTAEIVKNENGNFDVWLGERGTEEAHYKDKTAKEIGQILTEDIEAVDEVWNEGEY